jgi:hypothetical protein
VGWREKDAIPMRELAGKSKRLVAERANPPHSRALAKVLKRSETSMSFALLGGADTASLATRITPNQRRRYDQ